MMFSEHIVQPPDFYVHQILPVVSGDFWSKTIFLKLQNLDFLLVEGYFLVLWLAMQDLYRVKPSIKFRPVHKNYLAGFV